MDASILNDLRGKLEGFMSSLPMDDKKKMRMVLCVDEAAANIVEHSKPKDGEPMVFKVHASCSGGCLKVIFTDEGLPFDPTKAPVVDMKTHIRSGSKGGLGVHIMRLNLDIFEYEREGEQNTFTLGMNIQ